MRALKYTLAGSQSLFLVLFVAMGAPGSAFGAAPTTRSDYALLPPYCAARKARTLAWVPDTQYQAWQARLGPDFIHVHHYCNGLHLLNVARKTFDDLPRKRALRGAINEMSYTEKKAARTFVLQPEILLNLGRAHEMLGDTAKAVSYYAGAVQRKPDYSLPYAVWADTLVALGELKQARDLLERGLQQNPDSKLLRRRLANLDKRQQ